ncbi:MAG: tyrosine-type recombinase/integrase [Alphaproteobacteria bacterium]|nr:tyrosine-type recombinase/integrase [Alphaproteobacteria bacterium]
MARVVKDAQIGSRSARAKLKPRGNIYWRGVERGLHLGYRRIAGKNGTWWVRRYLGNQRYATEGLGIADDLADADGVLVLSFDQAQAKARAEAVARAHKAVGLGALPTVAKVVEDYITFRDTREAARRGRAVRSDAATRLTRYVLGDKLAATTLEKLDEDALTAWRAALPPTLRASTVARTTSDFRAALNAAYWIHRKRLGADFAATIKHGLRAPERPDDAEPGARDNQILTDAQVGALIRAAREVDDEREAGGDLFRLVVVLAATGARFGQVARMLVGDVQRDKGRLLLPPSRKGKGRKVERIPVPVGRDVLDALLPATTGRAKSAPLLERWQHVQVPGPRIRWVRDRRGAWQSGAELTRAWRGIRERAKAPDVIPYALRHSSIVRGLRAGLPIALVAKIHDTSTKMIEVHYAAWIAYGLDEMAARAVVPLVPATEPGVVPFAAGGVGKQW